MASVFAIISKAVFEKMAPKGVAVGDQIATDRYTSSHAAFQQLTKDDAIFLITVRPPNEALWLVGVIESAKRKGDAWVGAPNTTPIANLTNAIKKLTFVTGTGITAKKGMLGMSLQTPRLLTDADVALIRQLTGSGAVRAYRNEVHHTPAANKAKAQAIAAAAKDGEVLRFVNYRRPFTMLGELAKPQQKQLAQLTRQNRAGKPAGLVDDENWAPMELVDVLDVASGAVTHQLYVWPWGSGQVFVHDTTRPAGVIIQHGWDLYQYDDLPLRRGLAAAYATAKPKLAETIDFQLDQKPPPPPEAAKAAEEKQLAGLYKRLTKELGKSKERYRLHDDLTKAQQVVLREVLSEAAGGVEGFDFEPLGLPPPSRVRSWSGYAPPSVLEKAAGKWPVWKWLKAASRNEVGDAAVIEAVTKALSAAEIAELGTIVCDDDYDLFGAGLEDERGETYANQFQVRMLKLLGGLIDESGEDAAIAFAEAAQKRLKKEPEFWLGAIATFGLGARAGRRGEPFPKKFLKLAMEEADFLGHGANLRDGLRAVVELMTPADRETFVFDGDGPSFITSHSDEVKNGREYEVPCVLHAWWFVDLAPTDKIIKAMIESILEWDNDRKPTEIVIETIVKCGEVCVPHLQKALKKKSKYRAVLETALARIEKTQRRA